MRASIPVTLRVLASPFRLSRSLARARVRSRTHARTHSHVSAWFMLGSPLLRRNSCAVVASAVSPSPSVNAA
ncbi:MAG: hypothetical protein ABGY24_01770, partial [bacterium]